MRQGWRQSLIEKTVSVEVPEEFLCLADKHLANSYLSVLELADGCFYVGLTADLDSRVKQYVEGTSTV